MLKNYTKVKIDEFGTKRYYNDEGKRHRLDGPMLEWSDGTKYWYINGNRHRNIDPSYEYSNGEKQWWFKGECHRIGGSSCSTFEIWFIYDKAYTKEEYYKKVWKI